MIHQSQHFLSEKIPYHSLIFLALLYFATGVGVCSICFSANLVILVESVKMLSVSEWLKTNFGKIVEMSILVNGDETSRILDCEIIDVSLVLKMLVYAFSNLKVLCITSGGVDMSLKYFRVLSN